MTTTLLTIQSTLVGAIIGTLIALWQRAKKDNTESRHKQIMKYLRRS